MKLNCKRIDLPYTPGEEIFTFPEDTGLPFLFDVEEELARRISLTSLSVTSGGSFTAWFDCDEIFTDHAVTVYGSLKKGLKTANIEG